MLIDVRGLVLAFNNNVYGNLVMLEWFTLSYGSIGGDSTSTKTADLPIAANNVICISTSNNAAVCTATKEVNENPTTQIQVVSRNINDKNGSGASICSVLCLCF